MMAQCNRSGISVDRNCEPSCMPPRSRRAIASRPVMTSSRWVAGICASAAASELRTGIFARRPVIAELSSAGMRSDTLIPSDSASPMDSTIRQPNSTTSRRSHFTACSRGKCWEMGRKDNTVVGSLAIAAVDEQARTLRRVQWRNLAYRPAGLAQEKTVAGKFIRPEPRVQLLVGFVQDENDVISRHAAHVLHDVERGMHKLDRRAVAVKHIERQVGLLAQVSLEQIVAQLGAFSRLRKFGRHPLKCGAHGVN